MNTQTPVPARSSAHAYQRHRLAPIRECRECVLTRVVAVVGGGESQLGEWAGFSCAMPGSPCARRVE